MILDILIIGVQHSFFAKNISAIQFKSVQNNILQETCFLEGSLICDHIDGVDLDIPEWKSFLIKWSHWKIGLS